MMIDTIYRYTYFCSSHFYFPASGQAVVTGVVPSSPRFLPLIFIAHRVQQSHCSSIFHRVLLTHALLLFASQFVHKKKSQRIHTSVHSAGLELTKLTYTRLENNLIRHRGDRPMWYHGWPPIVVFCYRKISRNISILKNVNAANATRRNFSFSRKLPPKSSFCFLRFFTKVLKAQALYDTKCCCRCSLLRVFFCRNFPAMKFLCFCAR